MIKVQVPGSQGDTEITKETPSEVEQLIADIEMGNIECVTKGKYYILDKNTMQLISKHEIQDGQCLVMVPVVAGG